MSGPRRTAAHRARYGSERHSAPPRARTLTGVCDLRPARNPRTEPTVSSRAALEFLHIRLVGLAAAARLPRRRAEHRGRRLVADVCSLATAVPAQPPSDKGDPAESDDDACPLDEPSGAIRRDTLLVEHRDDSGGNEEDDHSGADDDGCRSPPTTLRLSAEVARHDEGNERVVAEHAEARDSMNGTMDRVLPRRAGWISKAPIGDEQPGDDEQRAEEEKEHTGEGEPGAQDADREGDRERAPHKEVRDLYPAGLAGRERADVVTPPAVPRARRAFNEEGRDEQGRPDDAAR